MFGRNYNNRRIQKFLNDMVGDYSKMSLKKQNMKDFFDDLTFCFEDLNNRGGKILEYNRSPSCIWNILPKWNYSDRNPFLLERIKLLERDTILVNLTDRNNLISPKYFYPGLNEVAFFNEAGLYVAFKIQGEKTPHESIFISESAIEDLV